MLIFRLLRLLRIPPIHHLFIKANDTVKELIQIESVKFVYKRIGNPSSSSSLSIVPCYSLHSDAARECRRKKKDYIKCLEERVTGLEKQNKALIEELRQLKELYCQREDTKSITTSR